MTELSAETRALLDAGRDGEPLSFEHRARMKSALLAKATAAGPVALTTTTVSSATTATLTKVLSVVAVVGSLGVAGLAWRYAKASVQSLQSPVANTAASVTPPTAAPTSKANPSPAGGVFVTGESQPAVDVSTLPSVAPDAPPPRLKAHAGSSPSASAQEGIVTRLPESDIEPAPSASSETSAKEAKPRSSLQEETRLLQEAHRALTQGASHEALRILEEHSSRFPHGILEPERSAERIMALCQAGRVNEAELAAKRFLSVERPPFLAARVRGSCGVVAR